VARAPRRTLRCTLQIAIAIALYLCLFPPTTSERTTRGELVVLAPGATASQIDAAHGDVVALPGVEVPRAIERVPDLATALRHHADARSLRIVGGGLPSRDRDAARGLVAAFDAAPLPHGIVELDASPAVTAGSLWRVQGRVEGTPNGRVELRDPAGAVAASAQLDGDGRFALTASAKAAGPARFSLRAFDAEGERVDDIDVPLVVREGSALRVLLFAGAPDAQLKYLRRWAADAGLALDSRIGLSEGVALTEGAAKLDAASLANADLAIVDERAWATLDAVQKDALRAAVRDGLGLLLRATGPLPDAIAQDWKAFGFDVQAAETAHAVSLDRVIGLADSRLTFTPLPFAITASDTAPLLRADDGTPLALSRVVGRGRVGIAWFTDEWRVALAGHRGAYATLWSGIVAQLARARRGCARAARERARRRTRRVLRSRRWRRRRRCERPSYRLACRSQPLRRALRRVLAARSRLACARAPKRSLVVLRARGRCRGGTHARERRTRDARVAWHGCGCPAGNARNAAVVLAVFPGFPRDDYAAVADGTCSPLTHGGRSRRRLEFATLRASASSGQWVATRENARLQRVPQDR
jgi:hypothetical protein